MRPSNGAQPQKMRARRGRLGQCMHDLDLRITAMRLVAHVTINGQSTRGTSHGHDFLLTQDILYEVLDKPDILRKTHVASAALVSRMWTAPAQSALYKEFTWKDFESRISFDALQRTMEAYPHLRPLLRSLHMDVYERDYTPQHFMQLLPPHCLRHLQLYFSFQVEKPRVYLPLTFWQIPAVQTLSSIEVSFGIHNVQELAAVLVPPLVHLTLAFSGVAEDAFEGDYNYPVPPNLRHLTATFDHVWVRPVYDLFIALSPQLESFTTDGPWYVPGNFHQWRDAAIAVHGRGLKKLLLLGQESDRGKPWCTFPFVDEIATHAMRLERLHVLVDTYTGLLFQNFPLSIKVLEFTPDNEPIPFEDELVDCLSHARERKLALARICLHNDTAFVCRYGKGGEALFTRIADACAASGIEYIYDECDSW